MKNTIWAFCSLALITSGAGAAAAGGGPLSSEPAIVIAPAYETVLRSIYGEPEGPVLRRIVGERVSAALRARDFANASHVVGAYESKQFRLDPPNPLALPARPREAAADVASLKQIFTLRPKLLRALAEGEWEPLHIVTGLNYLLGGRVSGDDLPDDFVGVPNMDRHTVVLTMQFHVKHVHDLERMRSVGIRQAKILCCNAGSCEHCLSISGKRFTLDRLPELPYEKCTSDMGCRCMVTAVIPGFE